MSGTHWTKNIRGGTRKQRGVMNKTEAEYARHLEGQKMLGTVLWFAYEGITFKIAEGARFTPDFVVQLASGEMECHEVKGYWDIPAKVRIRVAADKFPFRFVAFKKLPKKSGGGWSEQEF